MKYQKPFNEADPNASYVNGNPGTGTQGSIPPARAIEDPQRELADLITKSGLTPSEADLGQVAKAIQTSKIYYGVDTGSADALAITLIPAPGAYIAGMVFRIKKAAFDNATTTPTINVNGLGAKTLVRRNGGALKAKDLPSGTFFQALYDGTNFRIMSAVPSDFNFDPGASTIKAPKLVGFKASGVGQSYPTSTNTKLDLPSMANDNLGGATSTWLSNRLTIGSGEGGIWMFTGFTHFQSGSAALNFTSVSLRKNGNQTAIGGENAGSGLSSYDTFAEPIPAVPGDYFEWYGYQQSGSTLGSVAQTASAYLISAV